MTEQESSIGTGRLHQSSSGKSVCVRERVRGKGFGGGKLGDGVNYQQWHTPSILNMSCWSLENMWKGKQYFPLGQDENKRSEVNEINNKIILTCQLYWASFIYFLNGLETHIIDIIVLKMCIGVFLVAGCVLSVYCNVFSDLFLTTCQSYRKIDLHWHLLHVSPTMVTWAILNYTTARC